MLKLDIPEKSIFIEETSEFVDTKKVCLTLEHSLISVSRWESKWHKPFLSNDKPKTNEEILDYISCMNMSGPVDILILKYLSADEINRVNEYINDPMTATWFNKPNDKRPSREIVTSELIYYWMIKLGIPMECQKWHLNRLMTLIGVFSVKDTPPKKMSHAEMAKQRSAMNAARRAKYHTKG